MDCFDYQDKYTEDEIKILEGMRTRRLLKVRDSLNFAARQTQSCFGCTVDCNRCKANLEYNQAQVERTLSTREDIEPTFIKKIWYNYFIKK